LHPGTSGSGSGTAGSGSPPGPPAHPNRSRFGRALSTASFSRSPSRGHILEEDDHGRSGSFLGTGGPSAGGGDRSGAVSFNRGGPRGRTISRAQTAAFGGDGAARSGSFLQLPDGPGSGASSRLGPLGAPGGSGGSFSGPAGGRDHVSGAGGLLALPGAASSGGPSSGGEDNSRRKSFLAPMSGGLPGLEGHGQLEALLLQTGHGHLLQQAAGSGGGGDGMAGGPRVSYFPTLGNNTHHAGSGPARDGERDSDVSNSQTMPGVDTGQNGDQMVALDDSAMDVVVASSKWTKYKLYLWLFLEEPFVSPAASFLSLMVVTLIAISLGMAATEQSYTYFSYAENNLYPKYAVFDDDDDSSGSVSSSGSSSSHSRRSGTGRDGSLGTLGLRFSVVVFFTLEGLLRFVIAPRRSQFFTQPNNVADILAVLPFWCNNVFQLHKRVSVYFNVLSIFSSFFWVLKLTRYFNGWFLLSRALRDAARALLVPVFFLMIVVISGSSLLLLFEKGHAGGPSGPACRALDLLTEATELNLPNISDFETQHVACDTDAFTAVKCVNCVTITTLFEAIHYIIVCVVSIQITEVYGKDVASDPGRVWSVIMMFLGVIFLSMPIAIVGTSFSQTWFEQDIIILVEKVRSRMRQQGYTTDDLREVFNELDEDGSGSIEFHEFKRMLEAFHFFGSLATCRKLFNHFDCNGTGSISYQEFVCGIFPEIIDVDDLGDEDEYNYHNNALMGGEQEGSEEEGTEGSSSDHADTSSSSSEVEHLRTMDSTTSSAPSGPGPLGTSAVQKTLSQESSSAVGSLLG
ncbi:unnamed protein product, partial [Amoebophrya sp. A25]